MIDAALSFVRCVLRDGLAVPDGDIRLAGAPALAGGEGRQGIVMTLVNVEEDTVARNARPRRAPQETPPPLFVLTVLLSFDLPRYEDSLRHLSAAVRLLHDQPVFTAADATAANPFPASLAQLTLTPQNLTLEELGDLWTIVGCAYRPSAVYRVRMIH